jgi:RNA polymerase-binding transcription factor DksA
MAKKAQKAKAVKKAAKPANKAAAKPAAKKNAKPAKKVVKLIKKAAAKKPAKPAKKAAAKKPSPSKTVGKKVAASKTSITGNKAAVKKAVKAPAKPVAKKQAESKRPVSKTVSPAKPVKKEGVIKKVVNAVKNILGGKNVKKIEAAPKTAAKPTQPAPASKAQTPQKPVSTGASKVEKREVKREVKQEAKVEVMEKKKPESSAKQPVNKNLKTQPKPQVNTDTRTRYSDAELKEFKDLILKKLEEAKKDYELLKSTLSHKDDHGTDDTSPTFKLLEDGSDVLSKEETAHLAARQEKFIQALQNALIRIENKTYGICRVTGKLISKERLRSVPHATLSIDAKLEQNA